MLLSEVRDEYLAYRRAEGYKPATVQVDVIALNRVIKVIGDMPIKQITVKHIDQIYEWMTERRLKASTVNVATACMRSFFKWCIDRGYRPEGTNPALARRYRPRESRPMPRVPLALFPALLDAARTPRDRMFIALGLYTMGRKRELSGIQVKHVDLDSGEIELYISKTNAHDRMPISKELRREINLWIPKYEAQVGPLQPDWYLTPAVRGGRYLPATGYPMRPTMEICNAEGIVKYALAKIGVSGSPTGCHVLRRSAARAMFDELVTLGYDGALRIVSAYLHHSSVVMSERYLGLDLDRANRDGFAKGELMFPSLEGDNVVPFRKDEHERDQAV